MKLKYDYKFLDNFDAINEYFTVRVNIKNVIKKGEFKISEYFGYILTFNIILGILLIAMFSIAIENNNNNFITITILIIETLLFIIFFIALVEFIISYFKAKFNCKKNIKSILEIDEKGINITNENISIFSEWKNITNIIIGNYYIFFINKTTMALMVPINLKDKVLKAINKHNTNKKIKFIETE